jgi:hypothetical protein
MEAEKLVKNQIGIFSFAHFFDEFQTAEDFIDCIDITIKTITGFISEDTLKEEDTIYFRRIIKN